VIRCSVLVVAMLVATIAGADTFVARVVTVIDGDTVVVVQGQKKTTVRIAGIDAPEKSQPYGIASRDALAILVLRKDVEVVPRAVDDYGRLIGRVTIGALDVADAQLRRGLAWENSRYHSDKAMLALQAEAQRARRGLWASPNPQPPSAFRKSQGPTAPAPPGDPACGKKRYCSQMKSCEEATFYLRQCRIKTLDQDGDGTPCENLCKAALR
jgi:endonuclease YncB( thermonuclease family)